MPSPQHLMMNADQRDFFKRLARRMRDVGYLSIAIAAMTIVLNLTHFGLQLSSTATVDETIGYLSSYLNGTRSIDWSRVFLVLVEAPISIFIGYWLIQGAKYFAVLYGENTPSAESLMGGLLNIKRVVDLNYLRVVLLFGFIWLIVLFN